VAVDRATKSDRVETVQHEVHMVALRREAEQDRSTRLAMFNGYERKDTALQVMARASSPSNAQTSELMKLTRRICVMGPAAIVVSGCGKESPAAPPWPDPKPPGYEVVQEIRARMAKKFAGLGGAELSVGGIPGQAFYGVMFYREDTSIRFYMGGKVAMKSASTQGIEASSIPEIIRIIWHDPESVIYVNDPWPRFTGKVIGEDRIEVGSRIPQSVIDSIKKRGGGLRLIFRMANEGTYFGWAIVRDPRGGLSSEEEGGDVASAYYKEDRTLRKGWYIHRHTGIRHEILEPG
jgi:hypothetical protein